MFVSWNKLVGVGHHQEFCNCEKFQITPFIISLMSKCETLTLKTRWVIQHIVSIQGRGLKFRTLDFDEQRTRIGNASTTIDVNIVSIIPIWSSSYLGWGSSFAILKCGLIIITQYSTYKNIIVVFSFIRYIQSCGFSVGRVRVKKRKIFCKLSCFFII